ncbi:hypothetical protein BMS3Abin01_01142 [bacterium BMS3Abin01]|nr:hypothetical protein BMS3Abin01_01142 [bacterium BMS3Abin01]
MSVERPFQLSVRKADWRQLAVVELPLLALLAMLFAVTFLFTPGLKMSLLGLDIPNVVLCPVLALTGVPCLMCGITRSFLSMGGGDITGAFVFHPLGPVFYLMLAGLFLVTLFSIVTRKQFRVSLSRGLRRNLIWGGTAIILAAWLVKVVIWYQVGLL